MGGTQSARRWLLPTATGASRGSALDFRRPGAVSEGRETAEEYCVSAKLNIPGPDQGWFDLGTTAARMRVGQLWLASEAGAGRVPARRIGPTWFFHADSIEAAFRDRAGWQPDKLNQGVDLIS